MVFTRITTSPGQMGGVACLRGLRIPVATVVGLVAEGQTTQNILALHPDLEAEAVRERVLPLAAMERGSSECFAVRHRASQRVATRAATKAATAIFKRCKLFGKQDFEGYVQLALGAGGRRFESGRPDHFSSSGVTPGNTRNGFGLPRQPPPPCIIAAYGQSERSATAAAKRSSGQTSIPSSVLR
jgi:uncharacterized protein (DUF433 family)